MKENIKIGLFISLVSFVFAYLFATFAFKDFEMVKNIMFMLAFIIFTIAYVSYSKADKEYFIENRKFISEVKNDRKIQEKKNALLSLAFGGIINIIVYFVMLVV
ncbi:hypothetical protein RJG79_04080 [Mycoplasmatota bacterium WC44]